MDFETLLETLVNTNSGASAFETGEISKELLDEALATGNVEVLETTEEEIFLGLTAKFLAEIGLESVDGMIREIPKS